MPPLDQTQPDDQQAAAPSIMDKIGTARQAGYSDSDIAGYLRQSKEFAPKFDAATKAGYSDQDVFGHLGLKIGKPPALKVAQQDDQPDQPDQPGIISSMASAGMAGLKKNFNDLAALPGALKGTVAPDDKPPAPYEEPLAFSDLLHPSKALPKISYQLAASGSTLAGGVLGGIAGGAMGAEAGVVAGAAEPVVAGAGAVVGGALGATVMSSMQSFAPMLREELAKPGANPDHAYNIALARAGQEGVLSGAGWALFNVGSAAGPIKHMMLQALGVQPGLAVAQRGFENVEQGKPVTEGMAEVLPGAIVGTAVPMAGHAAVARVLRGRGAAAEQTPAAGGDPVADAPLTPEQAAEAEMMGMPHPAAEPAPTGGTQAATEPAAGVNRPHDVAPPVPPGAQPATAPAEAVSPGQKAMENVRAGKPATENIKSAESEPTQPAQPEQPRQPTEPAPAAEPQLAGDVIQTGDLWKLPEDQLRQMLEEKKSSDAADLIKALGVEGAKQWNSLSRTANSMDTVRANAASQKLQKIEDSMTAEQKSLAFGGVVFDENEDMQTFLARVREAQKTPQADDMETVLKGHNVIRGFEGDEEKKSLFEQMSFSLGRVSDSFTQVSKGNGTPEDQAAFVQFGKAFQYLRQDGVPVSEIINGLIKSFQSRGLERADAEYMVSGLVDSLKRSETVTPESTQLTQGAIGLETRSQKPVVRKPAIAPTVPEPARDIEAQVRAAADPETPKDAVFIAAGNEEAIPAELPAGFQRVDRPEGSLLTDNPEKLRAFAEAPHLTEDMISGLVGYTDTKAAAIASGDPRLVQGRDAQGNVVHEQVTPPEGVPAAIEAAKQNVPGGAAGEVNQVEAMARRLDAGHPAVATAPNGMKIDVTHRVVDAKNLIASNDDDGKPNPAYPQELQPRDRSRAASQDQVTRIARTLDPDLLGENPSTAEGAPIVSKAGVVESGNGRTMAIRRAYAEGGPSADRYRAWLESQGYDTTGMTEPMLVRVRQTELSDDALRDYTTSSNERSTLALSASERSAVDARDMGDALERFHVGDVGSVANRDFVRRFVQEAVAPQDRGDVWDENGGLTQNLRRRIEAALLHSAYGDPDLVKEFFESGDTKIAGIGGALRDVAGVWAQMRKEAAARKIPAEMDVTKNLVEATKIVSRARSERRPIADFVNQKDIFAGNTDAMTTAFLHMFFRGEDFTRPRARDKIAGALEFYANEARKADPTPGLFGASEVTSAHIAREANERVKAGDRTETAEPSLFGRVEPDAADAAKSGEVGQRPGLETETDPKTVARFQIPETSPAYEARRAKIEDAVTRLMDRITPGARGEARQEIRTPTGEEAHGMYQPDSASPGVIAWSLASPDALHTVGHEAIHYLRGERFFRPGEWSALEQAAHEQGWHQAYSIADRYPGETPVRMTEEAIAERYADWSRGMRSNLPDFVARIFQRIALLRQQIAAAARRFLGRDATPEDVFARVESGVVGRRESNGPGRREAAYQKVRDAKNRELPLPVPPATDELKRDQKNIATKVGFELRQIFSPTAIRGALPMEGEARAHGGKKARLWDQTEHQLEAAKKTLDQMSVDDRLAWWHRYETGVAQPTTAAEAIAQTLRKVTGDTTKLVQGLGKGLLPNAMEDYIGRAYSNYDEWSKGLPTTLTPEQAQMKAWGQANAKRPLTGSGNFLKRRTFPTLAEAMAAGLIPVTTNPIEMQMMKLREMQKYALGVKLSDNLKERGIAKWVPAGSEREAEQGGMVKLDDKIFQPRLHAAIGHNGGPAWIEPGNWYAAEPAARVFNNYMSGGLFGKSAIYDVVRGTGNALNNLQLSLSGFHATFVVLDTMMSKMALGFQQIANGRPIEGAKNVLRGGFDPTTLLSTLRSGQKLRKAWLMPAGADPVWGKIATMYEQAGGRIKMDTFYRSETSGPFFRSLADMKDPASPFRQAAQMFRDAPTLAEKALLVPFRVAGRVIETMSEPLMGWMVPHAKAGVFAELAKDWIERNPNASPEEAQKAAMKFQESIDNRMGQMVYDNLFWNKTMKDIAFITTRSVGWNLGTIREIAGGGVDAAKFLGNVARGKQGDFTTRMAYTMAMPVVTAIMGAALTYLATGKGPVDLIDYFFPPTGTETNGVKDRRTIPGYVKDVIEYYKAPVQTVMNKTHPLISMLGDLHRNKDYYGATIYSHATDNPAVAYSEYLLNQAIPFSWRSWSRLNHQGASPLDQALAFWGINPAPQAFSNPEKAAAFERRDEQKGVKRRMKEPGHISLSP